MEKKHGPWTIKNRSERFRNDLIQVYEDEVIKPDGTPSKYAFACVKGGASVLALDDDGFVYLAEDFRYAIGRESIEVVGGAIDEGEEPQEAARRELREELGLDAEEFIPLGHIDPLTSMVDSPAYLFLARKLKFGEPDQDDGETVRRVKMKFEEAIEKVMNNEITHGTSCSLILKAEKLLKKQ